jgi:hypothetical protein
MAVAPPDLTYWDIIAERGLDGDQGPEGQPGVISNGLTTISKTGGASGTPTALDLTQLVNKLLTPSAGSYTLADGFEGQLMYLVRRGAFTPNIRVANASIEGTLDTNADLRFSSFPISDVITLLFTDGAWQQGGGEWLA